MTHVYTVRQNGNHYQIEKAGRVITTPYGNPLDTSHSQLAELICTDLEHFGPDPTVAPSYVSLHCGYCDFGRSVPKGELVRNIYIGYEPRWDIALAAGQAFERLVNGAASPGMQSGFVIDPVMYFGPPEKSSTIKTWLDTLSRRALISVQTIGGNYQSILAGYRLLAGQPAVPAENLARGLVQYGIQFEVDQYLADEPETLIKKIAGFFEKAREYAAFGDD